MKNILYKLGEKNICWNLGDNWGILDPNKTTKKRKNSFNFKLMQPKLLQKHISLKSERLKLVIKSKQNF